MFVQSTHNWVLNQPVKNFNRELSYRSLIQASESNVGYQVVSEVFNHMLAGCWGFGCDLLAIGCLKSIISFRSMNTFQAASETKITRSKGAWSVNRDTHLILLFIKKQLGFTKYFYFIHHQKTNDIDIVKLHCWRKHDANGNANNE